MQKAPRSGKNWKQDLSSGVYHWKSASSPSDDNRPLTVVLSGRTVYFDSLIISVVSLAPQESRELTGPTGDEESLVLAVEGGLEATIGGRVRRLGRRSAVLAGPEDRCRLENTGPRESVCIELRYRSKAARPAASDGSLVVDGDGLACLEHDRGRLWRYFDRPTAMTPRLELHLTALSPGAGSHEPHAHHPEEILFLLEGRALVDIGGSVRPAAAGDLVFLGSNEPHALVNTGSIPCAYFALQWE